MFPILFGILIIFLYLGFYVHNRAILEEAVVEAASYGAVCGCESKERMQSLAQEKFNAIVKDRLYSMKQVEFHTEVTLTKLNVSAQGEFLMPVFSDLLKQVWKSDLKIEAEGAGVIITPIRLIWLTRLLTG